MPFLAPLWLLALIPWGALLVWVLTGRRKRERIPFLPLWDAPEELRRPPKKAIEPPPIAITFLLLATLSAILAAAGPRPRLGQPDQRQITILIDRGASMSTVQPRFTQTLNAVIEHLGNLRPRFRAVPATEDAPANMKRTAADTTADLQALARSLSKAQPVIIISDKQLRLNKTDDHIIQVVPNIPVNNTAITHLSARSGQVMARLRSTTPATRTLRITSDNNTVERKIDLKANHETDVFLDLPNPGEVIEAILLDFDDFDADNRAWIVRPITWPAITAWTTIPDELRRMLDVYAKHRPPGPGARQLPIVRPGDPLKSDEPAILLAVTTPSNQSDPPSTINHPILQNVNLPALRTNIALAGKPPGEGWTILARIADKPILAIRDQDGTRRAWVGFESRDFARTPDYVLFWTNLLDWTAATPSQDYTSGMVTEGDHATTFGRLTPVPRDADPTYWPGLFQSPRGLVALNTPPTEFHHDPGAPWNEHLARLPLTQSPGLHLRPWLALLALALGLAAALTWERARRRTTPNADPAALASPAPSDTSEPHRVAKP